MESPLEKAIIRDLIAQGHSHETIFQTCQTPELDLDLNEVSKLLRKEDRESKPEVKLPPINSINRLVRENFGEKYSGNLFRWGYGTHFMKTDKLAVIGHKKFLGGLRESLNLGNDVTIGRFESPDGSVLRVLPEYVKQAKKYAESYERNFGREVKIILDNKAADLSSLSGYTFAYGP